MKQRGPPLLKLFLLASWLGGTSGRGDLLGTTSLSVAGKYASNRFADSGEQGSSAYSLEPRLALDWFASPGTEIRTGLRYGRQEYQETGFGRRETFSTDASLIWGRHAFYFSTGLAAHWVKDSALPEDDYFALSLEPRAWLTDAQGREFFVHGYVGRILYDRALNLDGNDLDGLEWEVRPGFAVPLSRRTAVSLSGLVLGYASNEPYDKYTGYGGIVEMTFYPTRKWRGGTGLRYVYRQYGDDNTAGDDPARDDHRLSLNTWLSWRARPSLDLFTDAYYATRDHSLDIYTYETWAVRAGIVLTGEWLLL